MRAGATSASQPPIQVNERWSLVIKMFAHVVCKLLRMVKIWKLPEGMRAGDQKQKCNLEEASGSFKYRWFVNGISGWP